MREFTSTFADSHARYGASRDRPAPHSVKGDRNADTETPISDASAGVETLRRPHGPVRLTRILLFSSSPRRRGGTRLQMQSEYLDRRSRLGAAFIALS